MYTGFVVDEFLLFNLILDRGILKLELMVLLFTRKGKPLNKSLECMGDWSNYTIIFCVARNKRSMEIKDQFPLYNYSHKC